MVFKRGMLWQQVMQATDQALGSGALLPVPTGYEFIEDSGIRFLVRNTSVLQHKDAAAELQKMKSADSGRVLNPFLPYEKGLFVAEVSESHVAVLNKFNVIPHHLLIITRDFEEQEDLLTPADFDALLTCMSEYPSLGFYNGGEAAGASQRHKHLQLVPLPLAPEGPEVPIEPLIAEAQFSGELGTVPGLPFLHVVSSVNHVIDNPDADSSRRIFERYCSMLRQAGMAFPGPHRHRQSGPYGLLVTRDWMLLVPRSRECFGPISVNTLGFAGSLLVRNEKQVQMIKESGPMTVLRQVAFPF